MNITVALRFDDLPLKRFVGKVYDRITRMFRLLAFALPVLGLALSQSARPCTASWTDACVYDEDEDEDEEDAGLGADEDAKPFSLGDINFEESSLSLDYKVSAARSPTKNNVISYQDLANIIAVLRQQKDPKNIALFLEIADAADASCPLETLATLTNANFSITLWLTSCSNLVDVAVLGGMPLKELSLGLTGDSLRAVRGLERCPLETLSISGGGLSSLSDICPLPHVKKLELCYTGLAEPSREEVKARFPELDLLYFRGEDGAKTVPFFSETERFAEAVKDADRVIVRKVSWDMGPKDFERAPALVTLTDPREIAAFRALFRFRDKGEFFDCFCAGNPLIDWYRGDVRLARTPVHHLQGLKWDRFYGAAFFTAEAQAALRAWFAEHQIECK